MLCAGEMFDAVSSADAWGADVSVDAERVIIGGEGGAQRLDFMIGPCHHRIM